MHGGRNLYVLLREGNRVIGQVRETGRALSSGFDIVDEIGDVFPLGLDIPTGIDSPLPLGLDILNGPGEALALSFVAGQAWETGAALPLGLDILTGIDAPLPLGLDMLNGPGEALELTFVSGQAWETGLAFPLGLDIIAGQGDPLPLGLDILNGPGEALVLSFVAGLAWETGTVPPLGLNIVFGSGEALPLVDTIDGGLSTIAGNIQNTTSFDESFSLPNGGIVTDLSYNTNSAGTVQLYIARRISSTSVEIVSKTSYAHGGGGHEKKAITPYTIPQDGNTYICGVYGNIATHLAAAGTPTNIRKDNQQNIGTITGMTEGATVQKCPVMRAWVAF